MSRIILVLFLILGTSVLFFTSCGGPDKITVPTGSDENPSANESGGEEDKNEEDKDSDKSGSGGGITGPDGTCADDDNEDCDDDDDDSSGEDGCIGAMCPPSS